MRTIFLFFVFFNTWANAQKNNFTEHTVKAKETVFSIAKKYEVTPFDIYRLNPDAKNGIQENITLLIPKTLSEATLVHQVGEKETLFGIAKKYKVTVADLELWNKESLKEGLKKGQDIYVSKPSSAKSNATNLTTQKSVKIIPSTSTHTVLAQETKYGIATKYGLTVAELEKLNPQIVVV